jgi:hypothetical protein
MRPGSFQATVPLLSVLQVMWLVVVSRTNGTPRPVCRSTILIWK